MITYNPKSLQNITDLNNSSNYDMIEYSRLFIQEEKLPVKF